MQYNLEILNKYIDKGLIIKQVHPTLPLSIYNYSRECQFNGNWDRYTLACRGLVLDNEGNVIAKPFPKFFNWEEIKDDKYAHCEGCRRVGMINCAHPEECGGWEMRSVIPNESFEVYEKMDGSLGIIFYYEEELSDEKRYNIWFNNNYQTGMERFFDPNNLPDFDDPYYEPTPRIKGEWHMATRGSFQSEQAIKGMEILNKYNRVQLMENYTYLVEIIYPENRIVVDYGKEERLVLLGIVRTDSGEELDYSTMCNESDVTGIPLVMKYKTWGEDWETLKKEISKDNEGYVIRFSGGMRMKIKGDEYVRLHKILTNFSTKDIWELLRNNEPLEPFLERVPDEFDKWVKAIIMNLRYSFHHIDERAGKLHDGFRYGKFNDRDPEPTKKEFAEYVKQFPKELAAVMFKMWDKQPYDHIIWSMIKPKYEKPFKKDTDL
jgi:RNA ligase